MGPPLKCTQAYGNISLLSGKIGIFIVSVLSTHVQWEHNSKKPWVFNIQNLSSLLLSHKGYRLDATWSHKFSEFLYSISAAKPNCVCQKPRSNYSLQKLCSLKLNLWWVVLHIKLSLRYSKDKDGIFDIAYQIWVQEERRNLIWDWETPPSSLHAWSKSPPLTTMYLSTTKYIDNYGNLYYHQNT